MTAGTVSAALFISAIIILLIELNISYNEHRRNMTQAERDEEDDELGRW